MRDQNSITWLPASAGRISLAPVRIEHLEAIRRWRSDPEVTRYWISKDVPEIDELMDWLAHNRASGSITLIIENEMQESIGYLDVFGIDRTNRKCEIALMIGERDQWGKGYAGETLTLLLGCLFRPESEGGEGMHKVTLAVFAENEGARRVYEKCGFREDGVLREDMYRDGRWHDQILMSILEQEFKAGDDVFLV